jgi:hypothetical protein
MPGGRRFLAVMLLVLVALLAVLGLLGPALIVVAVSGAILVRAWVGTRHAPRGELDADSLPDVIRRSRRPDDG